MSECRWKPDFDKWYNVNKDAYKFILAGNFLTKLSSWLRK